MRQHTRVLVPFLVVATLTLPLSAQQGESFAERVDVNIVNIDVLVSDKQGKPNPSESMLLERNAGQQMQEARRGGGNDVMDAMRGYATTLKRDTTRSLGALT